jgi:hypothetical protein
MTDARTALKSETELLEAFDVQSLEQFESMLEDRYDPWFTVTRTEGGVHIHRHHWTSETFTYPLTKRRLLATLDRWDRQDRSYSMLRQFEEEIEKFEGFKILITNKSTLMDEPFEESYRYRPAGWSPPRAQPTLGGMRVHHERRGHYRTPAGGALPFRTWVARRLRPLCPDGEVIAVLPDGRTADPSTSLQDLRAAWPSRSTADKRVLTYRKDKNNRESVDALLQALDVQDLAELGRVLSVITGEEMTVKDDLGPHYLNLVAADYSTMEGIPTCPSWLLETADDLARLQRNSASERWLPRSIEMREGFIPRVRHNDVDEGDTPEHYPYPEAAPDGMTVADWVHVRFDQMYPQCSVEVTRPDGSPVRSTMKLGTLRKAWGSDVHGW